MKRRQVLKDLLAAGAASGALTTLGAKSAFAGSGPAGSPDAAVEKVKMAMLSMQRHA